MKGKQSELFDAIYSDSTIEAIAQILQDGADINGLHNDQLPLTVAVQQGNYTLVEFLLGQGAKVNSDLGMQTALEASIYSSNEDIFHLLLEKGANVNLSNKHGINPFVAAINSGKGKIIKAFLERKVDMNPVTQGQTPLAAAAMSSKGDAELVKKLIENGAEVNPAGASQSPLTGAAMIGNIDIVKLLLANGAEVNPVGASQTPLAASIQSGREEIFELLVTEHKADINLATANGNTPFGIAISAGKHELAIKLINSGADVKGSIYGTPYLHQLVWNPNTELLKLMLEKGAEVNAKDGAGKNAYDLAIQNNKNDIAAILKEYGAEAGAAGVAEQQPEAIVINNWEVEPEVIAEVDGQQPIAVSYNAPWVDPMIAKTEELRVAINNKDIKAIEKIIQEGYWGNFDWLGIKSAITETSDVEALQSLLITSIKYKPELTKILFENNVSADQKQIMHALCEDNSMVNYTIILPILLNQQIVKIDWNQIMDEKGNNFMMKMFITNRECVVGQFIGSKTLEGLPIFEINHTNLAGYKLIDLYKMGIDNLEFPHLHVINILRELGSSEPLELILGYNLDINDVHNTRNEVIIKKMMKSLHSKHNLDEGSIKKNVADLKTYIQQNTLALTEALGNEGFMEALSNLQNLQEKDQYPSNEHNVSWLFTTELAYLYLEAEKIHRVDNLVQKISCLPVSHCKWGSLVHIYSSVEECLGSYHAPVVQFHKLQEEKEYYKIADKAIELLKDSGLSDINIKKIVDKFHTDVTRVRNDFKDVSLESELLMGVFYKILAGLAEEAGHSALDIYSDDCAQFYAIVSVIVDSYQWSDTHDETVFYQILAQNIENTENEIHIIGDDLI